MRTLNIFLFLFFSISAYSQTPVVTENSAAENFVGEDFCFEVNFTNEDMAVGYQPYIRFIVPPELDVNSIDFGPSAAGQIILSQVFDVTGIIEDPIIEEDVLGPAGHTLIVFEMPIGSVVEDGPDLITDLCVIIDENATINSPLDIDFIYLSKSS